MAWRKLGQLYAPQVTHPKLLSHAANPLAVRITQGQYRVYYSGRDAENRSSVGYVELDLPTRHITYIHPEPVFEHGPAGSFYAQGVSIGNAYRDAQGMQRMLFMGWQTPPGEHWRGEVGSLTLAEDGTLSLSQAEPFLPRNAQDAISLSYPWVHRMDDGSYRMCYGSTHQWDAGNGEMLHALHQAHSADGITWQREALAVPYALNVAQAFSRPTITRDAQGYHLWFSFRSGRGEPYRIGYAQSADAVHWHLALEQTGIDVSQSGWDSQMICYPFVFEDGAARYMLYNGNGYGMTGFGLAIWEKESHE